MTNNQITVETSLESILKQAAGQRSLIFSVTKAYPAYFILIISILLSIGAWYLVEQKVHDDRQNAFDKASNSVMRRLEFKYQNDYQVLQSMRSLYDNYVQVVRDVFELYGTIPTRTYPSIITIMYSPRVHRAELESFIHYARSEGYYDYELHPVSEREVYYPVEYVVPIAKNYHKSGFDLATNNIIKRAIEKSRDSNIVTSTPIFNIRPPDTTGFYMISPVYAREAAVEQQGNRSKYFIGVLLLEVNSQKFFETALGSGVASDTSIVFQCFDTDSLGKERIVFESSNSMLLKTDYEPDLQDVRKLKVADRTIQIKFATIPNFGGMLQELLPIITFVIAILISIGISSFVLSIISSRTRALALAEKMTHSQRRIVESSNDIIAVLDLNGIWRSMNPASNSLFEYSPDEIIGKKIDQLISDDEGLKHFYSIIHSKEDEVTDRIDTEIKTKSGKAKWVSWSLSLSLADGLVYCIGRDITIEKLAEEEAALRSKQIQLAEQLAREVSEFKTYFMMKLSHQLRNSLTGMIGYLQLLSQKVYENEQEHDNFVALAEQSSEELYTFISDIGDVASSAEAAGGLELSLVKVNRIVDDIKAALSRESTNEQNIEIELIDETNDVVAVGDNYYLTNSLTEIFKVLSEGMEYNKIQLHATENQFEGATEIQILSQANNKIKDLILKYNQNLTSHIEALKFDKKDVILKLALAASTIRMMNGSMKVETLDDDNGNIVQITLPLNKPQS